VRLAYQRHVIDDTQGDHVCQVLFYEQEARVARQVLFYEQEARVARQVLFYEQEGAS
jgi:hypothetical protein